HVGMGAGDGATSGDLLAEDRDDASRRAEHVPEADAAELRAGVVAMPPGLDDPLAQRLRLTHDRLRIDRLVRRHEDEALRTELDSDVRHGPRHARAIA